ncbi:hypothetical protein ACLK19_19470 [Escherichia coli]
MGAGLPETNNGRGLSARHSLIDEGKRVIVGSTRQTGSPDETDVLAITT